MISRSGQHSDIFHKYLIAIGDIEVVSAAVGLYGPKRLQKETNSLSIDCPEYNENAKIFL